MLALGKQLTEEQRLSKAVIDIMPRIPEISGLLMIGERVITDDPSVPTACTNGRDEWYGRAFVASLSDAELRFVIIHEVFHKMYRHLVTWAHLWAICSRTANISMDYDINGKILEEYGQDGWVTMPEGGCHDPKYKDWGTAKIFWYIYDEEDGGGGGGRGNHPQGFDSHDWEGAEELTDDEKRELGREIDEAIRQGALIAGKMGTGGDLDLDKLLQPQVDWREVLREFVQSTCTGHDYSTWARPNRRYIGANVYLPSSISERVDELVIAIDTSASISQRDITTFLSEVKSICDVVQPETVRLLYWDTSVCGDEKYNGAEVADMVTSTKPKGGGGTYVECVTKHMQAESITPQAVIVFTDGYLGGQWGTWSCPVLWCLLNNDRAVPDNGKLLRINNL